MNRTEHGGGIDKIEVIYYAHCKENEPMIYLFSLCKS